MPISIPPMFSWPTEFCGLTERVGAMFVDQVGAAKVQSPVPAENGTESLGFAQPV